MPKLRRPTGPDRDLVDAIARLALGSHKLTVESTEILYGFGLARLKPEGSMSFELAGKRFTIVPERTAHAESNRGTRPPDQS